MGNVKSAFQPDEVVKWGNDPRVLSYLATHDPRTVIDGDYVLPQSMWGQDQRARIASGQHLTDGGYENGLAYGKTDTHITASKESPLAPNGGVWDTHMGTDRFTPSQVMINQPWYGDAIREYFPKREEGHIYRDPRGLNIKPDLIIPDQEKIKADYTKQQYAKNMQDPAFRKQEMYSKFAAQDKPIQDASMDMFLAAQGPKIMAAYGNVVPTTISRAARSIREKDITRMAGLPSRDEFRSAMIDPTTRDKVMWKMTGNGVKANNWANMNSN